MKQREIDNWRNAKWKKGDHVCPPWIVQPTLEMLCNGTPPHSVCGNTVSLTKATRGNAETKEPPSTTHIQGLRTRTSAIAATLVAHVLGKEKKWAQPFTDGTSWRQVAFQNLIVGALEDDKLCLLVSSSAIVLKGDTAEEVHDVVLDVVLQSSDLLEQLWCVICPNTNTTFPVEMN